MDKEVLLSNIDKEFILLKWVLIELRKTLK